MNRAQKQARRNITRKKAEKKKKLYKAQKEAQGRRDKDNKRKGRAVKVS